MIQSYVKHHAPYHCCRVCKSGMKSFQKIWGDPNLHKNLTTVSLLALSWVVSLPCMILIFCNARIPDALLNGSSVISIPTAMEPTNMTYLWIFNTKIQTLDLRQLVPYTSIYALKVETSPVTRVVSAQLPTLSHLYLNSLDMFAPPDFGPLSPQRIGLALSCSTFITIPENYFSIFTRLTGLGLMDLD